MGISILASLRRTFSLNREVQRFGQAERKSFRVSKENQQKKAVFIYFFYMLFLQYIAGRHLIRAVFCARCGLLPACLLFALCCDCLRSEERRVGKEC